MYILHSLSRLSRQIQACTYFSRALFTSLSMEDTLQDTYSIKSCKSFSIIVCMREPVAWNPQRQNKHRWRQLYILISRFTDKTFFLYTYSDPKKKRWVYGLKFVHRLNFISHLCLPCPSLKDFPIFSEKRG